MTFVPPLRFSTVARAVVGAAAFFLALSAAWAQVTPQNLTVGFQLVGAGPSIAAVPLSDWLTAGIAMLIAVSAFAVLRRRHLKGGKLLSALLVVAASATMFGVTGEHIIGAASAAGPVSIMNLTSPIVNVAPLAPNAFVQVNVVNNTGQAVQLTSINLDTGIYIFSTPTTCTVGLVMSAGAICSIQLAAQS